MTKMTVGIYNICECEEMYASASAIYTPDTTGGSREQRTAGRAVPCASTECAVHSVQGGTVVNVEKREVANSGGGSEWRREG